jgi:hypothetical protein
MTKEQVKAVLDRVLTYHATPEELKALDEAERSGVASDQEVEAAFQTFRRP